MAPQPGDTPEQIDRRVEKASLTKIVGREIGSTLKMSTMSVMGLVGTTFALAFFDILPASSTIAGEALATVFNAKGALGVAAAFGTLRGAVGLQRILKERARGKSTDPLIDDPAPNKRPAQKNGFSRGIGNALPSALLETAAAFSLWPIGKAATVGCINYLAEPPVNSSSITYYNGDKISASVVSGVEGSWANLPETMRSDLIDNGIHYHIGYTLADIPSYSADGIHYIANSPYTPTMGNLQAQGFAKIGGNSDGIYFPSNFYDTMALRDLRAADGSFNISADEAAAAYNALPGLHEGPTFWNRMLGQWYGYDKNSVSNIFNHETMHHIDDFNLVIEDPSFRAAYELDLRNLGLPEANTLDPAFMDNLSDVSQFNLNYCIQGYNLSAPYDASTNYRGPEEAFAYCSEEVLSLSPSGTGLGLAECFPHTTTWIREFVGNYDQYRLPENATAPIDRHIDTSVIDTSPLCSSDDFFSFSLAGHAFDIDLSVLHLSALHLPSVNIGAAIVGFNYASAAIGLGLMTLREEEHFRGSNTRLVAHSARKTLKAAKENVTGRAQELTRTLMPPRFRSGGQKPGLK
ncbi:MAG: hypothetical protein PHE27_08815 [Alphaproteobacteria bacterium]|nr:hypothetical protein [Alphaproteobacteria bacterium]